MAEMPRSAAPMLATLTEDYFSDPGWIFERKFDGVRCLAHKSGRSIRLLSRNRKEINRTYPELAEALVKQKGDFVVDGEIVAFEGRRTSFSRLQRRIGLEDPDEARGSGIAVFYYLFDILHSSGEDTAEFPLRRRKSILRETIDFEDPIRFTPHRNEHGERHLEDACRKEWEGLIAKRADAPYRHGRSRDWLKFKCSSGQELVIVGYTPPGGSRVGFGALVLGVHEDGALKYAGKVGTGFDDETIEHLKDRMERRARATPPLDEEPPSSLGEVTWIRPDLVAEIAFTEWTGAGRLRHPRFRGLRTDKDPEDVVREKPS